MEIQHQKSISLFSHQIWIPKQQQLIQSGADKLKVIEKKSKTNNSKIKLIWFLIVTLSINNFITTDVLEVTNLANDVVPSASTSKNVPIQRNNCKNIIAENCTWFCTWLDCNSAIIWREIFEGILDEQKFDLKFLRIFSKKTSFYFDHSK